MPLTPQQIREGMRLQRRGLLLREPAPPPPDAGAAPSLATECAPYRPAVTGDNGNGLRMKGNAADTEARPTIPGVGSRDSGSLAEGGSSQCGDGAPPAPSLPAGATCRLRSPDGQYLHESCACLTRLSRFFWRGTAAQAKAVKARWPRWAGLTEEALSVARGDAS